MFIFAFNSPSLTPTKPDKSSPHPPSLFMVHFNIILPLIPRPSKQSLFFVFQQKPCIHYFFTPCVTHALPILSSLSYPRSNNWQEIQVLKLLLIQFSPTSCYFLPLAFFLTSSQVPIVNHLHPVIVSLTWTNFTPI
jgi:hypothetical protein